MALAGMAASIRPDAKEVRRRWFVISHEYPPVGELRDADRIKRLAAEFGITPAAMRVRLQQTKLIRARRTEVFVRQEARGSRKKTGP